MSDEQVPVGRDRADQRRRPDFPQRPAGRHGDQGRQRQGSVSEYQVKPAANLSKLEEVLVLVEKQERQATAEDQRARARGRYSGAAVALGARQACRGRERRRHRCGSEPPKPAAANTAPRPAGTAAATPAAKSRLAQRRPAEARPVPDSREAVASRAERPARSGARVCRCRSQRRTKPRRRRRPSQACADPPPKPTRRADPAPRTPPNPQPPANESSPQ